MQSNIHYQVSYQKFMISYQKSLRNVQITNKNIIKINNFDPNNAHSHNMISVWMLKLGGPFLCKPYFQAMPSSNEISCGMEKGQCGSNQQKRIKQCIKNHQLVFSLPICSKIFKKILFYTLYKSFNENDLLSSNQSGFRPSDSCINQLLSITAKYIDLLIMISR